MMYEINEAGLKKLQLYTGKLIADEIGVNPMTINNLKSRKRKIVNKQTAYCLTKLFNPESEIEDYFTREEKV